MQLCHDRIDTKAMLENTSRLQRNRSNHFLDQLQLRKDLQIGKSAISGVRKLFYLEFEAYRSLY